MQALNPIYFPFSHQHLLPFLPSRKPSRVYRAGRMEVRATDELRSSYYDVRSQAGPDHRGVAAGAMAVVEKKPGPERSRDRRIISAIAPDNSSAMYATSRWGDSEMKRRRRVAVYKAYGAEGRIRDSLRKGLRWVKSKYFELIMHGW